MADHTGMIAHVRYNPWITLISPDLDDWLPRPSIRIRHQRQSSAPADRLWHAAQRVRVGDAALLGRLVRWRIPGIDAAVPFDQMFRNPPFCVLEGDHEAALVSGLVGRIWTLRRDYPLLSDPEEFRSWSKRGTARVLFANWVQDAPRGRCALVSETRVEAFGMQGRMGLAAVRPLVRRFHHLVGSDGMEAAVRRAESGS